MKFIQILTTAEKREVLEEIAHRLLEQNLAACVQILPRGVSFYHWQNEVRESAEYFCLIKTAASKFAAVSELITEHHPYELPEIIALPIEQTTSLYGDWLQNELRH
jgi:periplasmic divalent cation tolerance protein